MSAAQLIVTGRANDGLVDTEPTDVVGGTLGYWFVGRV
jgi:hypothetical protein